MAASQTHGLSGLPEYGIWVNMRLRCGSPRNKSFDNYGGRGIRVCDRWLESFEAFLGDMGRRPSPKHSIDRIDVNGNYEPGNCRWATRTEQGRNRRNNTRVTFDGREQTISEWAQERGISEGTISARLRHGCPSDVALASVSSCSASTNTTGRSLLRSALDADGAITQSQLARMLGIKQPSISGWISGKARPETHLREALEILFCIPARSWMTEDESKLVERLREQALPLSA